MSFALVAVLNLYAGLAVFMVVAGLALFWYLSHQERAKPAEPPPAPAPKAERQAPPPKSARPAGPGGTEQAARGPAARETAKHIADQPFRVRAEIYEAGFSVQVGGGIAVGAETIIDLIITLEDIGNGSAQPVFATQAGRRDEQTGQFVLRSTLGKVTPPGRSVAGWTSVGTVSLADISAPRAGRRNFRLSCLAVPSSLSQVSLVDERLRGGLLAATSVTFGVDLRRRGYVEERRDRTQAAGLVLCLAFAFAERGCGDRRRAEPGCRRWMEAQLARRKPADRAADGFNREALEAAYGTARESDIEPKLLADQMLACRHPDLAREALRLCVEISKEGEVLAAGALAELKHLRQLLGLDPGELRAALDALSGGGEAEADQERAALIGLDLSWDQARIRRHLLAQFNRWNSRHPRDAAEREAISLRLDAIARLRQRYL